jgi:Copper type II ascorbate-dependent monooxygenase, C-terminal domain/Copper type II ascorbate-dependent monooxygenase, N-terminal domain
MTPGVGGVTSGAAGSGSTLGGGTAVAGGPSAGGATSSSGGEPGVTPPVTPSGGLPCDIAAIVKKNCSTCHGAEPLFGAQFSLTSVADFKAIPPGSGKTAGERALARMADDARPMPPPPNARVSADDMAKVKAWIDSGYQGEACTTTEPNPPTGGTGGMAGTGGASPTEPSDVTCYNLTARAAAGGAKYSVPTTPDLYQCFNWAAPWGNKKVQVVSATPIIDNAKVLHHWILYNTPDQVADGTNASCVGAHPNAAFITGWAPGGDGLNLPDDVGLRTEGGGFSLELHYNNKEGAGQLDASGARICVTEKLRPNEAAVHWLGTQSLNKTVAKGTCSPTATQPVTILSMSPHMHLQGRHMSTAVNRKAGGTEMLLDKPFDFQTQISYPVKAVINPGDTLTTTCTYAAPTPFGQGTNQEMCYNFVMAYPAGQLAQPFSLLRKYDCTN